MLGAEVKFVEMKKIRVTKRILKKKNNKKIIAKKRFSKTRSISFKEFRNFRIENKKFRKFLNFKSSQRNSHYSPVEYLFCFFKKERKKELNKKLDISCFIFNPSSNFIHNSSKIEQNY